MSRSIPLILALVFVLVGSSIGQTTEQTFPTIDAPDDGMFDCEQCSCWEFETTKRYGADCFSGPTFIHREEPRLRSFRNDLILLNMSGHGIERLDNSSFIRYTALATVDLRNGTIQTVDDRAFHNLPALETLDLRRNQIHTIANWAFNDTSANFSTLHLQQNNLTSLQPETFRPLTNLRRLDLSFNRIAFLNLAMFSGVDVVTSAYIVLTGNPWYCDCRLQVFIDEFLQSQQLAADDNLMPVCETPETLRGFRWNATNTTACDLEVTPMPDQDQSPPFDWLFVALIALAVVGAVAAIGFVVWMLMRRRQIPGEEQPQEKSN